MSTKEFISELLFNFNINRYYYGPYILIIQIILWITILGTILFLTVPPLVLFGHYWLNLWHI